MGGMLSAPVELVRIQRRGNAAFQCAVAEMQGWRTNHEDAHEIQCVDSICACLVLDGHGGDGAANFGAPALCEELCKACAGGGKGSSLPSNDSIAASFESVDAKFRAHVSKNPEKDSGSTVVGALIAKQGDGTYSAKLLNCGDSRAIVFRGRSESQEMPAAVSVRWPPHMEEWAKRREEDGSRVAEEARDAARDASGLQHLGKQRGDLLKPKWPVIVESVDHKPDHPIEKERIQAAGGFVSGEEPPRLDGNLAVSRGLGDFEYKSGTALPVAEQKVSCVPDIYEVSGLPAGSICLLACDGLWDVMDANTVADFVLARLGATTEGPTDLGDIAAELVKMALTKNSRDNVTCLIALLGDGSDYAAESDEMQCFEKLEQHGEDSEVATKHAEFLKRASFELQPLPCSTCKKWRHNMQRCPCQKVHYCDRQCQKKGWKTHKTECSTNNSPAAGNKTSSKKR